MTQLFYYNGGESGMNLKEPLTYKDQITRLEEQI